jgi:hypothetical protein
MGWCEVCGDRPGRPVWWQKWEGGWVVGFVEVPTCFVCVPAKEAVSMERSYDRWLRRQVWGKRY